ncbi:CHRD domain-containing protein [Parasphingopyxis marina]|uniref:CHRD domain-containing protein n=1 Tax=Parasphingopyxis marina TaxID=2761622 RepID=A0A842HU88_9SPHN|nr:CHRD domain-containing protein [Parasphingopyxis marina]MBC2776495.1 CHRD domain-containing protein [Parasphingopyxis marina]
MPRLSRIALFPAALPLPCAALAGALAGALALTACATIADTVGETYTTGLSGGQEVPGPDGVRGDPDGSGTARITADATTNNICFALTVQAISQPTAAHIHRGARGEAGPPVLTLDPPLNGRSSRCYSVERTLAAAIIANPAGYYVNVHTADYPGGAVRGQLSR